VVNVVGPFQYQAITETSPEEWQETIALNLHTCFNLTHYALPYLCESKGHIVNFAFAGVENIKAWPMSAAYCAAKTGIAVLTKSWATALAAKGVRVNAICPGLVEEGTATEAERKAMAEQIPLGRPVRPQEVAATVKWLLTDSPASMTGSLLAVSGAWEY
jgi:3-oxoacyl-[acyl-carrier protein] reductase